ncbi:MAG: glycoside hydrolase family 32 protein [Planctomycetota bacterium]
MIRKMFILLLLLTAGCFVNESPGEVEEIKKVSEANLEEVWAKLQAEVEAGNISAEEAEAKMIAIKKDVATKTKDDAFKFNESSKETEQIKKLAEASFDNVPAQIAGQLRIRELMLSDPHRPIYHFVSFEGRCMPFDPDGAIFWNGKYHLCYIFQDERGHCWGHASSKDLLHWRWHTTALFPGEGDPDLGIFSGNCFVNKKGEATMLYHGVKTGNCIATCAEPELDNWTKLPSNPIIPIPEDGSPEDELYSSWDPHGWIEGDTYYAIFGGNPATIFKAQTLDKWEYVGPLLSEDMTDVDVKIEDVSCPDFFELGNKHALMCISHSKGCRIYLGEWKDEQFYPEVHQRMNWSGGTCFAPESLVDEKGRRIMWAWVLDRREELHLRDFSKPPKYGWSGTLTLPRVLSLDDDGTLLIEPIEELKQLRMHEKQHKNITVKDGESIRLLVIEPGTAEAFGLKVCSSPDGREQTVIECNPSAKNVKIDFERSSLDKSIKHYDMCMNFMRDKPNKEVTEQAAPFELRQGEKLELRIFIDRSILEVFANGRQCITQRIYPTRKDSLGVELFSKGGSITVESIKAWDMAATNPW